ncbi:hypothetical protein GW915_11155 [bacterium]|nr:hypothetical protein [bacterium]
MTILLPYLAGQNPLLWVLLIPVGFVMGTFLVLLFVRGIYTLFPAASDGKFKVFKDRSAILWSIENAFSNPVLNTFQGVLFMNEHLRTFFLWCLRSQIHPKAMITTRTIIGNPRLLFIDKGVLIGEHAHLAPSIQPKVGLLFVSRIRIGADSLIAGYVSVLPGVWVGRGCCVQAHSFLSLNVRLGDRVTIGARSVINEGVTVGEGSRIGKDCRIMAGAVIPPKTIIKDGQVVTRLEFSLQKPSKEVGLTVAPEKFLQL